MKDVAGSRVGESAASMVAALLRKTCIVEAGALRGTGKLLEDLFEGKSEVVAASQGVCRK